MATINVIQCCLDSIRQISDQVSDALVYLDSGCLEAFQLVGAFPLLMELRVRAVCSLENVSPLDITVSWNSDFVDAVKIVIITSRLLSDAHRYILRCLGTHQTITQCAIFTSISEIAHSVYPDSPLGPDAFREYESLLIQDYEELKRKSKNLGGSSSLKHIKSNIQENMGWEIDDWNLDDSHERDLYDGDHASSNETNDWCTKLGISVQHFPMIFCPLSSRLFIFPSESTSAEACLSRHSETALSPGLPSICIGRPPDGEDIPPGATLTAHFLHHLASKMDLKMEIFSLGDLSKTIGKMLTDMSGLYDSGRRNKRSAGLLLVDRTLDLLTPLCHGDSVVDRMFSLVPRRKRKEPSSLVKTSQIPNKFSSVIVRHAPIDYQISLDTIFVEEKPSMNGTQQHEVIKAFQSGWNSVNLEVNPAVADQMNKVIKEKDAQEISFFNGPLLSSIIRENYLEALLMRKTKDGSMLINKLLLEALQQHEKESVHRRVRPGLNTSLDTLVKRLVPDQLSFLRNKGIIQLALASELVLRQPHYSHWDAFLSAERIMNINSLDSSQSLSGQIRDFISTSVLARSHEQRDYFESSHGLLSLRDALLLSAVGYILAGENFPSSGSGGPFSWEEEHYLKEAVVDAILEKPMEANFRFLQGLEKELQAHSSKQGDTPPKQVSAEQSKSEDFDDQWDSWDTDDVDQDTDQSYGDMQLKLELRDRVDSLFKIFHRLSNSKQRTSAFKEGLVSSETNFGSDAFGRKGLLYRLLNAVLAKYDVPGIEYHSSAVGRFFKSGFGRLGIGQARPTFGEQSALIIFVVGGISTVEVSEVMEVISESTHPDAEVILGGTTILTPDNMFDLLFGSSSYI